MTSSKRPFESAFDPTACFGSDDVDLIVACDRIEPLERTKPVVDVPTVPATSSSIDIADPPTRCPTPDPLSLLSPTAAALTSFLDFGGAESDALNPLLISFADASPPAVLLPTPTPLTACEPTMQDEGRGVFPPGMFTGLLSEDGGVRGFISDMRRRPLRAENNETEPRDEGGEEAGGKEEAKDT